MENLTLEQIYSLKADRETDALVATIVLKHNVRVDEDKIMYWEGFTTLAHYSNKELGNYHYVLEHMHKSNKPITITNTLNISGFDWFVTSIGNSGLKLFQGENLALAVCKAALYVFSYI